jgi:mono/diheme cytochrome c family protein
MRRILISAAVIYAISFLVVARPETAAQGNPHHGRDIFRYDTFGDEQLWTTFLRMNEVVGTLSPMAALDAGLKVDSQALPPSLLRSLRAGLVNLDDPAVTVTLLELNAVVGLMARVNGGTVETVGITCALCHSVVDDSVAVGVGRRLDGWPNRDLNVGGIVALSPALNDAERGIFNSWGRGKFDPRLQAFDGEQFIPLNSTTFPVLIPPAYGLRDVGFETYTGDGPISYWNNYVGVTQMGGHGSFSDPRIPLTVPQEPDQVTPKLPALLAYQLQLKAPAPPRDSYDKFAARRGERVFNGAAGCAECHIAPTYTDVWRGSPLLHDPAEVGAEPEYASRSVTKQYRTSPLRGIWQHPPYFHDGSAQDLSAVVARYEAVRGISLSPQERADLIEFLKSL